MNKETLVAKETLLKYGKYVKTVYGICREFEWKVVDFENERYQVSMFDNEVIHVARIYCELCGRPFLPSKIKTVHGSYTCVYCASKC